MGWWPFRRRPVAASAELRAAFGVETMARPDRVRAWFEGLLRRYPFADAARAELRRLRFEAAEPPPPEGRPPAAADAGPPPGPATVRFRPEADLVLLRTVHDAAGLYGLALAWWARHADADRAARFGAVAARLAAETDPRWAWAATLAAHHLHGIRSAASLVPAAPVPATPAATTDPTAVFAGLAAGILGDLALLPGYAAAEYADLFSPNVDR